MTADRRTRILAGLDVQGQGLEIGAGYSPVATSAEFRVDHLDHADHATLVRKYAEQGIDTSRIPAIDYVWSGETYASLVGAKRYDWIIASHVIEHLPDPIAFFNDCAAILTENGVLSLVVPDKRSCFDYYRPPSSLARLVDAHARGDRTTTPGAVAEHIMYASTVDGAITWESVPHGTRPEFFHTPEQGRNEYESAVRGGEVHDVHVWAFSPAGFRLVADDLYRLGLVELRERSWYDTCGYEFFVQFSRQGTGHGLDRAALAKQALAVDRTPPPHAANGSHARLSPTVLTNAEQLVRLAQTNARGEMLVRGASGHPQYYLIRDGVRHAIATPAWTEQHHYSAIDAVIVDDDVILALAEGSILTA